MKNLTASDRTALIKLASSLPQGDDTRKAILAGLKTASVDKQAGILATKARVVRNAMELMVDNLDAGLSEPGDYYTLIRQLHQFLIATKNTIAQAGGDEEYLIMKDMTALIRLLQAQFS